MASPNGAAPRVVVGVDGSDASVDALRWAASYGPVVVVRGAE